MKHVSVSTVILFAAMLLSIVLGVTYGWDFQHLVLLPAGAAGFVWLYVKLISDSVRRMDARMRRMDARRW